MLSSNPTPNSPLNAGPASSHDGHSWSVAVGWVCLIWSISVAGVCALGYCQIWRHFSQRPRKAHSSASSDAPHVTVIRPVKGLEPYLYECLAATFRQDYPREKSTVYFCVATKDDPAYPILQRLIADFPRADARIFVEEEDPLLQDDGRNTYELGPNPKIRNMSRAYREAKGDIVWIIDCNVWVGRGVCGRMVDRLCGYGSASGMKYKFVHHLPIAVDVQQGSDLGDCGEPLLREFADGNGHYATNADTIKQPHGSSLESMLRWGGGRLEELFLSSSHAKMYTAINTVLIAPCIVGKSNMFRRSHLDSLTPPSPTDPHPRHPGIDFFSDNICEDHLIGDLLWRNQVKEEKDLSERWGKHALVFGDLAIQPIANMSVQAYLSRRVRWQRVRKFTVLLATLVEPGTESILCSLYGAWGVTTALARFLQDRGYPLAESLTTWVAFAAFFLVSMCIWVLVDWTLYAKLHSAQTVELDDDTPSFARPNPRRTATTRRPFGHWFAAWLGRECLALPIWIWAFYGGVTVTWRDRRFKVGLDMKVRAIDSQSPSPSPRPRSPRHDCPPSETRCRSRNCSRNPQDGRYKVRHD